MPDPRITKLAATLVQYSVDVQSGDFVLIRGSAAGEPLIREVYREVLQRGGNPFTQIDLDLGDLFFKHASDAQLQWVSPIARMAAEQADAMISIRADANTRTLSGVDPKRQSLARAAQRDIMQTFMQRAAAGKLKWVGTLFPTNAYAQEADMSLTEYEDFVYGATFADQDDPVACWQEISAMQQKLVDWLKGKKQVVVKGPHADLTLSIEGRTFANSDGHHNMPSGEIFTGPVEESVNGWVEFTYPAITAGREVDGIRLVFKDGKVVEASAKKNEDFLHAMLDTDEGARYLGEFAIGTNDGIQRFTKSILFDEKIGGTIHMAVGNGYPETGSKNQSAIHWDMICGMQDGGEIIVDGELFYRNGEFVVKG
jgi:aminopeptidase